MSLSGLLLVASAMHLRCTFLCVSPHLLLSFLFLFCFVFLQAHTHTHKMHIAVDLNASFAVHAGSCVWRLLSSSVAMRRREEGVRSPRHLSCGCGAPRMGNKRKEQGEETRHS
ncbi:mucin TcMUCII [Trypanosoma cruzi]|nr:mucin TcMUCII [Trypanosoma cruzi]